MKIAKKLVLPVATLFTFLAAGGLYAADLTVKVTGFKDEKVGAIVYLWKNPDGFPKEQEKATTRLTSEIKDKSATVVFTGLTPGVYAVSIAHDENGNGKLDTGFMGKPKEGYGTSNNPHHKMSAPSFDECKVTLTDAPKTIEIQVLY